MGLVWRRSNSPAMSRMGRRIGSIMSDQLFSVLAAGKVETWERPWMLG